MVQKVTLAWGLDFRNCIRRAPHCGLVHVVPTKPCRHETLEMSRHVGRLRRRPVIRVYTSVLPNTSPSTGPTCAPLRRCTPPPERPGPATARTPHTSTRSSRPRHQRSEATRRRQQNKQASTQTRARASTRTPELGSWGLGIRARSEAFVSVR